MIVTSERVSSTLPQQLFFGNLEAMRGVCAVLVALFHVGWVSNIHNVPIVKNGWLFVDYFFILSGFVIAHNYASQIQIRQDVRAFAIKRVMRLWPLHVVTFVIAAALTEAGHFVKGTTSGIELTPRALLEVLTLVHGLGASQPSYNAPSWSISAEFWTYMAFAAISLSFESTRARILVMLCIGASAFCGLLLLNHPNGLFTAFQYGFLRCLAGFALGMAGWFAWSQTSWCPSPKMAGSVLVMLACVVWFGLDWVDQMGQSNCFVLPVFVAIVFMSALDQGSCINSFLNSPLPRLLGRISYSIYMLHVSVLVVMSYVVSELTPHLKAGEASSDMVWSERLLGDVFCIVYVAALVAAAQIAFRWIEDPCRRSGRKLAALIR